MLHPVFVYLRYDAPWSTHLIRRSNSSRNSNTFTRFCEERPLVHERITTVEKALDVTFDELDEYAMMHAHDYLFTNVTSAVPTVEE